MIGRIDSIRLLHHELKYKFNCRRIILGKSMYLNSYLFLIRMGIIEIHRMLCLACLLLLTTDCYLRFNTITLPIFYCTHFYMFQYNSSKYEGKKNYEHVPCPTWQVISFPVWLHWSGFWALHSQHLYNFWLFWAFLKVFKVIFEFNW